MLYTERVKEDIRMKSLSATLLEAMFQKNSGFLFSELASLHNASEESIRTTLWRLEKRGVIEKRGEKYFISREGKRRIEERQQPEQWDEKWRILTFDIPESERASRIWLRAQLLRAGYETIQKSIFVGKNPIPKFLLSEMKERNILSYVRLIVAGHIYKNSLLSEKN